MKMETFLQDLQLSMRKIQNNAKQKLADELDSLRRRSEEDLDEEYRQRIEKIVDNSIER